MRHIWGRLSSRPTLGGKKKDIEDALRSHCLLGSSLIPYLLQCHAVCTFRSYRRRKKISQIVAMP